MLHYLWCVLLVRILSPPAHAQNAWQLHAAREQWDAWVEKYSERFADPAVGWVILGIIVVLVALWRWRRREPGVYGAA